ncbi:MAG: hypothetical protein ACLP1X_28895 [Polyangiaceae bacterium]
MRAVHAAILVTAAAGCSTGSDVRGWDAGSDATQDAVFVANRDDTGSGPAADCTSAAGCDPGQVCCAVGGLSTACQDQRTACSVQACATSQECLAPGRICGPDGSPDAGIGICQCPQERTTTVSGTVYDPANVNPLYNVAVYIPNAVTLPALPQGVSCNPCSGEDVNAVASAVTDAMGYFSISNAPDGANIPLVVQVGKWRMAYTLASIAPCQDNPQPDHSLRLPKNHTEGDLPNIAISTGAGDSLECLPLRMGVDADEYVGGAGGTGRIHVFTGYMGAATQGGTSPDPGSALWDSDKDIDPFDYVLLSCEEEETANMNQQVLLDYANSGGRVFASHFHYAWFNTGPFTTLISPPLAMWTPGAQPIGSISGNLVTTLPNGMPFPEGVAMNTWLGNVGALTSGELSIVDAFHNVDVGAANTYSETWVSADNHSSAPGGSEYFSFDTPVGSDVGKCGRVVYSDLHVSGGPGSGLNPDYPGSTTGGGIVPNGCSTHPLTPQEQAIEFMMFDIAHCTVPLGQQ